MLLLAALASTLSVGLLAVLVVTGRRDSARAKRASDQCADISERITALADSLTALRTEVTSGLDEVNRAMTRSGHLTQSSVLSAKQAVAAESECASARQLAIEVALSSVSSALRAAQAAPLAKEPLGGPTVLDSRTDQVEESLVALRKTSAEISLAVHRARVEIERVPAELAAHQLLVERYLPGSLVTPAPGGWAATSGTLGAYINLVEQSHVGEVVECGSGISTVWASLAIAARNTGRITALEHQRQYADQTERALAHFAPGATSAHVACAALVAVDIDGVSYTWYDPKSYDHLSGVEVVLVDGPAAQTGSFARFPALPLLWNRLASVSEWILYDTTRDDESSIIRMWEDWVARDGRGRLAVVLELPKATVLRVEKVL